LPAAVDAALGDPGPARELAGRWGAIDRLVVAGRGLGYAAALETALKVAETTGILAEGMSAADLYHGPIAAVYAGAPVLLVNAGGPAGADVAGPPRLLHRRRAATAGVAPPAPPPPPARRSPPAPRGPAAGGRRGRPPRRPPAT